MIDDFTGFPLNMRPEPLPFGNEATDNVAELAGWKTVILYYLTVIEESMQLQTSRWVLKYDT